MCFLGIQQNLNKTVTLKSSYKQTNKRLKHLQIINKMHSLSHVDKTID